MGRFPRTRKGSDYLYVVIDRFIKFSIFTPCEKTIKEQDIENMLFEKGLGVIWDTKERHFR